MPDLPTLLTICVCSFIAGFVDSIVGGGGLIQTPALLINLPNHPLPTLLGTTKLPSLVGTFTGAVQYARRVVVQWQLLWPMALAAFLASAMGSYTLTRVPNAFMRPLALVILTGVFIYTLLNRNFGQQAARQLSGRQLRSRMLALGSVLGFYDGFFGPGTGSFLVMGFVSWLGFDFLRASAHAKWVNVATNMASLLFFASSGHILYAVALPMAIANVSGAIIGVRLALLRGNRFIRVFFLCVIAATLLRFSYDVWHG